MVNGSANAVDLSGFSLYAYNIENQTGRRLVHIFPNGSVIDPDGAIVIFGGGIEADLNERSESLFGGAIIQVANRGGNGVNLPDSLDGVIELVTTDGFVVDEVVYLEENANQIMAVTRSPDITGDFGVLHLEASGSGIDLSPGNDIEGNPFSGNGVSNDIGGAPVEGLEGWFESSWLGFYAPIDDSDWLPHGEHGYIYYFPDNTASNAFIYDDATSTWWWTAVDFYPFIYMFDPPIDNAGTDIADEWVYYFLLETDPRVFGIVTGAEAGGFLFFP